MTFGEFVSGLWQIHQKDSTQDLKPAQPYYAQGYSNEPPLNPPSLAKYEFNPKRVESLIKEYGAMLPTKDVYCTPDPKAIQFIKLMKDYLDQCHAELNYFEAKRCREQMTLLQTLEYQRQMRRMAQS